MAFDADEEILQDFLIEAGEILESLSQQLVDLENNPEDMDLLNAIFRGYHTVKGGAGFLGLTNLVEICHAAENVFDRLRNGELTVTPDLMDVALQALDCVNEMFEMVKAGEEPGPAPEALVKKLEQYSSGEAPDSPEADSASTEGDAPSEPTEVTDEADDTITEDEFEALLDELHGGGTGGAAGQAGPAKDTEPQKGDSGTKTSKAGSDEITEEEFEALLDELHGTSQGTTHTDDAKAPAEATVSESGSPAPSNSDEITEEEFEALLDQLHGQGKAPGAASATKNTQTDADKTPKSPTTGNKPDEIKKTEASHKSSPQIKSEKTTAPTPQKPAAPKTKVAPAKGTQPKVITETTVRVDTRRLDEIMNLVGELVLVRNRLLSLGQQNEDEGLLKAISNLDVVTGDLQGAVMKTRMQPIKKVFGRFPRVVRDLARNLKKEITLKMVGEETDLDKNLVEALADPLVHLVRNSVDHGIEMPDVREKNGKSRTGTIVLSAAQEGDHILLSIEDDGAGMDPEVLRQKAVEKGLMDAESAARLTEQECYNLIFMPGFSTKTDVSDISGRGVGMDVVKTRIAQLNGTIRIESELGKGTRFSIKVPLTLAILPTLMVTVGRHIFAFPLASVSEIFHLDLTRTNIVDGQLVIVVREKAIPLFYLQDWLLKPEERDQRKDSGHVVLFQVGTRRVGFVVDTLIGQEEVVIKPLGPVLHGTPGMAGATITSDGTIALILDVPSLLNHYARR